MTNQRDRNETKVRLAIALTVCVAIGAAGVGVSAFPWMRDMYVTPVVAPHMRPAMPPAGVLGIGKPRIMDRIDARRTLRNPIPPSPDILARGTALYDVYCAMCHGETGAGGGNIASYFQRVPDLNAAYIQNYPDGWLYSIVREGGFNMPPFGSALDVDERWAVVHYVRTFGSE